MHVPSTTRFPCSCYHALFQTCPALHLMRSWVSQPLVCPAPFQVHLYGMLSVCYQYLEIDRSKLPDNGGRCQLLQCLPRRAQALLRKCKHSYHVEKAHTSLATFRARDRQPNTSTKPLRLATPHRGPVAKLMRSLQCCPLAQHPRACTL